MISARLEQQPCQEMNTSETHARRRVSLIWLYSDKKVWLDPEYLWPEVVPCAADLQDFSHEIGKCRHLKYISR